MIVLFELLAPNASHMRQTVRTYVPNGSYMRQTGSTCAKRVPNSRQTDPTRAKWVPSAPNGSHSRQTGPTCAKQVPSAPGRSLVRHTDQVHSRQTGPTCMFENPTSALLIVPDVTITLLRLLDHVRTFYIARYTSSTTHPSQPHI